MSDAKIRLDVAKLIRDEAEKAYRARVADILPVGIRIKFLNQNDITEYGTVIHQLDWGANRIFVKTDGGGYAWIDPGVVLDTFE